MSQLSNRAWGGLLVRRERWTLSWPGKLGVFVVLIGLAVVAVRGVYPFLACNRPVSGDTMVVEGWIPNYTLEQAARAFNAGNYRQLIVVRPLYQGKNKYETGEYMAEYIAEHLITLGVPKERVSSVFLNATRRDRTYSSAQAAKNWLLQRGAPVKAIDVATQGTHARRSRLLYQMAFGKDVQVGVIVLEDLTYDPAHWWRYSAGVRDVPAEFVAYLYAKFLFSPHRREISPMSDASSPAAGLMTRLFVMAGTLAVCLVLLEVGLRVAGRFHGNTVEGYWEPGGISYKLKKNASTTVNWPTATFTVYTSDLGFRDKQTGPRLLGRHPYYAVLGSSEIFGNGLDYEQTLIGVFAGKMEHDGVEILNMAVGGHSLDDQISIFKEFTATAEHLPSVVLICLNPLLMANFDDHHPEVVVRNGYLFPKNRWRYYYAKTILQNKCATYCFIRDTIRNIQTKLLRRQDEDVSYYFDFYSRTNRVRTVERQHALLSALKNLEDDIRKLGAQPVCVFCPTAGGFLLDSLVAQGKLPTGQFDTTFFAGFVESHCRAEKIQLVNLEPPVEELHRQGKRLNIELDGHFNGATSQVIGDFLYESLRPGRDSVTK